MMAWENRAIEPVYLCESHADQLGRSVKDWEGGLARTSQSVGNKHPTRSEGQTQSREIEPAQLKGFLPSGSPADTLVGEAKTDLSIRAPVLNLTNDESAKRSVNEAMGNMVREDFEAHGTALQDAEPSTAVEGKQSEIWDLGRMCRSRNGEPCTCEATVHCSTCGAWFCDAHAEDEKWHPCVLTI